MLHRKHMAAIEIRSNFVLPNYESILGDHPFVATTLNCIGSSYQALGDYDNAIKFTRRALEIRKRLLGHHQETARSLYDLGVAHLAKKEYERWVRASCVDFLLVFFFLQRLFFFVIPFFFLSLGLINDPGLGKEHESRGGLLELVSPR